MKVNLITIYSFIQQIFIEHLLGVIYCFGARDIAVNRIDENTPVNQFLVLWVFTCVSQGSPEKGRKILNSKLLTSKKKCCPLSIPLLCKLHYHSPSGSANSFGIIPSASLPQKSLFNVTISIVVKPIYLVYCFFQCIIYW